jgi:hypothetical protein
MPRHRYHHLQVSCLQPRVFPPNAHGLRQAVEHLKTLDQAPYVGVTLALVKAGGFKIDAPAFLKLEQIEGKTPAEVWEEFDRQIDKQIEYFERRGKGSGV